MKHVSTRYLATLVSYKDVISTRGPFCSRFKSDPNGILARFMSPREQVHERRNRLCRSNKRRSHCNALGCNVFDKSRKKREGDFTSPGERRFGTPGGVSPPTFRFTGHKIVFERPAKYCTKGRSRRQLASVASNRRARAINKKLDAT